MSLSGLLDLVGRPHGTAKFLSPFQTKVADLTWAVVNNESSRVMQTGVYGQFPACNTYLALLIWLAGPRSWKVRIKVNGTGQLQLLGVTDVEGTLDGLGVPGGWNCQAKVVGTVTYKWESETKWKMVAFKGLAELEVEMLGDLNLSQPPRSYTRKRAREVQEILSRITAACYAQIIADRRWVKDLPETRGSGD
ncbi:hypothetical protein LTR93_010770 [Exophiala xenobiotica]|nr:hypothetical protein LTR93_010770 [Exophiala xenobiotica]